MLLIVDMCPHEHVVEIWLQNTLEQHRDIAEEAKHTTGKVQELTY